MRQKTIQRCVEGIGIGLHKGEPIRIVLEPMEADSGIIFYRQDIGMSVKAHPSNVINTQMATVIGISDKESISTIEHLLSAVNSYGIDNLRIIINGGEIPVMDGSSASFCMMLDEAGIRTLEENKKIIVIKKEVEVRDGNKFSKVTPSNEPTYHFIIDFEHPAIGRQEYTYEFGKKNFLNDIARARTFGFLKEAQILRSMGLGLGGSLDNTIILDEKKILNPEGLRFQNEFVRHKILDAIGDLCLLGMPMLGNYDSFAGSHKLNHMLTKEILKDPQNYEVKTLASSLVHAKAFA
ncbi:MAG: UDP-3-O-acyl-N-acetylglucosamine deacetylase [Campylobacteraceae bacterium]|nr:UDP-3-O-acyl-N-acetylglucosamine deacetylase [Campylobacteraceae bacterium]